MKESEERGRRRVRGEVEAGSGERGAEAGAAASRVCVSCVGRSHLACWSHPTRPAAPRPRGATV